ncbi:hypothetical protein ACQZV8_13305 [Magnetococcales bacterium HHB-1]
MITLSTAQDKPFTIDLPFDIKLSVKPITTTSYSICQAIARQELQKIIDCQEPIKSDAQRDGLYKAFLIYELAAQHVTSWEGVTLDGKTTAPLNRDNLIALMDRHPFGERFYEQIILAQMLLEKAKNGSTPSQNGSSETGENTAKSV